MELRELRNFGVKKKRPPTYYYRNQHGKVISLTEEIALEQHKQHPEYLGSSEDLDKTGFNMLEAIASHLKKNVSNPKPPPDKRRVGNAKNTLSSTGNIEVKALKKEIEELKKIIKNGLKSGLKNGLYNQKPETKIEGNSGDAGKAPQGNTS